MPNIKILTFYDGEFMDIDCLSAFKKLGIFMTKEKPSIEIPETINFFVFCNEHYNSAAYKDSEKELARVYSDRFSEYLHTMITNRIIKSIITIKEIPKMIQISELLVAAELLDLPELSKTLVLLKPVELLYPIEPLEIVEILVNVEL
uniref:RNA polymerase Rpb4 n=1 Tax=Strongyloides venezuelensis TaxID=75913 RepID=A0A0K0EWD4_STRVS